MSDIQIAEVLKRAQDFARANRNDPAAQVQFARSCPEWERAIFRAIREDKTVERRRSIGERMHPVEARDGIPSLDSLSTEMQELLAVCWLEW